MIGLLLTAFLVLSITTSMQDVFSNNIGQYAWDNKTIVDGQQKQWKNRKSIYLWNVTCIDCDGFDKWSQRMDWNQYTKHYNKTHRNVSNSWAAGKPPVEVSTIMDHVRVVSIWIDAGEGENDRTKYNEYRFVDMNTLMVLQEQNNEEEFEDAIHDQQEENMHDNTVLDEAEHEQKSNENISSIDSINASISTLKSLPLPPDDSVVAQYVYSVANVLYQNQVALMNQIKRNEATQNEKDVFFADMYDKIDTATTYIELCKDNGAFTLDAIDEKESDMDYKFICEICRGWFVWNNIDIEKIPSCHQFACGHLKMTEEQANSEAFYLRHKKYNLKEHIKSNSKHGPGEDVLFEPKEKNYKIHLKEFEDKLYSDVIEWIDSKLHSISFIWTITIAYLIIETPVESLCSILKWLYRYNRRKLRGEKLKKLCLSKVGLPDDDENRTKVVKYSGNKIFKKHGDGIIKWKRSMSKREANDIKIAPVIDRMIQGTKGIFKAAVFVLE